MLTLSTDTYRPVDTQLLTAEQEQEQAQAAGPKAEPRDDLEDCEQEDYVDGAGEVPIGVQKMLLERMEEVRESVEAQACIEQDEDFLRHFGRKEPSKPKQKPNLNLSLNKHQMNSFAHEIQTSGDDLYEDFNFQD